MRKYLFTFFIIFFFCSKKNENGAGMCPFYYKVANYNFCKKDINFPVCPNDWEYLISSLPIQDEIFSSHHYNPCDMRYMIDKFGDFKDKNQVYSHGMLPKIETCIDTDEDKKIYFHTAPAYEPHFGVARFIILKDFNGVKNCHVVIRTHCCGVILMFEPENIEVLKQNENICKGSYPEPVYIHLDSEYSQNFNFNDQPCNICMEENDPHDDVDCELQSTWIKNPDGPGCVWKNYKASNCYKLIEGYKPLEHVKGHIPRVLTFSYDEKEQKWFVWPVKCKCMGGGKIGDCDFSSLDIPNDDLNHTFISIQEFMNLINEQKIKCEELKNMVEEEKDIICKPVEFEPIDIYVGEGLKPVPKDVCYQD